MSLITRARHVLLETHVLSITGARHVLLETHVLSRHLVTGTIEIVFRTITIINIFTFIYSLVTGTIEIVIKMQHVLLERHMFLITRARHVLLETHVLSRHV